MTQFLFRRCKLCGEEKPASEYYAGVNSRCKDCHKARMRELRLTNPAIQERDRVRARTPHRKAASRGIVKRWRAQHPEAYRAQTAVNNAVRDKRLAKTPCVICGTDRNVHGHHKNYSRPLDVTWLCAKCHHRVHVAFPELGGHHKANA